MLALRVSRYPSKGTESSATITGFRAMTSDASEAAVSRMPKMKPIWYRTTDVTPMSASVRHSLRGGTRTPSAKWSHTKSSGTAKQ